VSNPAAPCQRPGLVCVVLSVSLLLLLKCDARKREHMSMSTELNKSGHASSCLL
jgi:hypothetical protein